MGRLHIRFPHRETSFGGVSRVNRTIAEILARRYELVEDAADADLQVCSLDWDAPTVSPRLFIDHGSFADAGFWAFTAPKLLQSDTILVTSRVCEQVAERMFSAARPALQRVPLFADVETFRPADDAAALRRELSEADVVPSDGPLLTTVAGYSRRKNLHLSIRFLADVRRRVAGARLAIVGQPSAAQGDYVSSLDSLVRELGLAGVVHFVSTLPQARLRDLLAASDLLLHLTTCRLENFGLVVAESLASGLPVVAADWGGLRDLVEPDRNGLLARTWLSQRGPRVDWRGCVAPAAGLLEDRNRRAGMARAAVEFAHRELSLERFEQRLCQAVDRAIDRSGESAGPVGLTQRGEDLMFATLGLHRARPGIRSASEEYRALLDSDPELCRFLSGPAATDERPPRVGEGARLYRVVAMTRDGDGLRITDPAWEARLALPASQRELALAGDPSCGPSEQLQALVDQGLLAPMADS